MPSIKTVMLPQKGDESYLRHPGWATEWKWDGTQGRIIKSDEETVTILNKRGVDYTERLPELTAAALEMEGTFDLDGEIVVLKDGKSYFTGSQRRCRTEDMGKQKILQAEFPVIFMTYEVTKLEGKNIENMDYESRKDTLKQLIANNPDLESIQYVPHYTSTEDKLAQFQRVIDLGAEGLVAKRLGSRYVRGKQNDWRKVKKWDKDRVRVVGYTLGEGKRAGGFGALILAREVDGELVYTGKVGTGFNDTELSQIMRVLEKSKTVDPMIDTTPVEDPFVSVDTTLEVTVKYQEMTEKGVFRMPSMVKENKVNQIHYNDPTIKAEKGQTNLMRLLRDLQ